MNSGDAKRLGEEAAQRLALTGQRSRWPDWRDAGPGDLRERLAWPVEGALFDVQHNALWHPSWGQRPADTSDALSTARQHLSRAPKMIPVCSHRYLPAGRGTYGHPVLSIYQTDIIVYGTDLADYINNEFGRYFISADWTPPMVPFWSDFLLPGTLCRPSLTQEGNPEHAAPPPSRSPSVRGQRPRTAASISQAICRTSAGGEASHVSRRSQPTAPIVSAPEAPSEAARDVFRELSEWLV